VVSPYRHAGAGKTLNPVREFIVREGHTWVCEFAVAGAVGVY